jgi:DNA-binding CsgD family transcriptional regulator
MLKDKIEQVLKTLTYREREIIKLRYGIGDGYTYTLEEVGRIFKVTRERVRQVEAKAIRKLQHPVRARKLEGFLPGHRILRLLIHIHAGPGRIGPAQAAHLKAPMLAERAGQRRMAQDGDDLVGHLVDVPEIDLQGVAESTSLKRRTAWK